MKKSIAFHIGFFLFVLLLGGFIVAIIAIPDPTSQRNNKAINTCYPYQVKSTYVDGVKDMAVCAGANGVEVKEIAK